MLRPSIRGLCLGEVRSHPGKVLCFRPQNVRLVLAQLASLSGPSSSRSSWTCTSTSRGSGGCRSRSGVGCGGGCGAGAGAGAAAAAAAAAAAGAGGTSSRSKTPKGMSSAMEPEERLFKQKESKWNTSKNMDDNGGPDKELTLWLLES